jgi:hypothetical protein
VGLTQWHMSTISSTYYIYFPFTMIVFHQFFTWTALGDVDLHLSFMFVRKANATEEQTRWTTWLHHQRNPSIHVTDNMKVTSLSASLLQKISVPMDGLCQIVLNWKWSRKCKKWCTFSSHVKAKSCKMKFHKMRPACTVKAVTYGTERSKKLYKPGIC